jgi:hypothetical protein
VLHLLATITDSGATVDAPGWSLATSTTSAMYAAPNGGSISADAMAGNTAADCDTYATVSNTARLTDGDHTLFATASSLLYAGKCGLNCTLTIGYWKTHAGFTGRNADRVTPMLPQWLGNIGGLKTVKVTSAGDAVSLLSNSGDASNGVNKLYSQMLAAKLNISRGASPAAVNSILGAADSFLAANSSSDWSGAEQDRKDAGQQLAVDVRSVQQRLIGPGHCN